MWSLQSPDLELGGGGIAAEDRIAQLRRREDDVKRDGRTDGRNRRRDGLPYIGRSGKIAPQPKGF